MTWTTEYQAENPYRSATAGSLDVMDLDYANINVGELRAFVGPNADYYMRKWSERLEDPEGDVGMNWASFFVPAFWLGYRKMYWTAVIYCALVITLTLAVHIVFINILESGSVPVAVNLILNVMTSLVCGLYGNAWYLSHARRVIRDARARGLEGNQLFAALGQRGGTSVASGFGVAILGTIVAFFIGFFVSLTLTILQQSV